MKFFNFNIIPSPNSKCRNTVEDAITFGDKDKLSKLLKKGYYTNCVQFCICQFISKNDDASFLEFLNQQGFSINFNNYEGILIAIAKKHYNIVNFYCSTIKTIDHPTFKYAFQIALEQIKNKDDLHSIDKISFSFKNILSHDIYQEMEKTSLYKHLNLHLETTISTTKKLKI